MKTWYMYSKEYGSIEEFEEHLKIKRIGAKVASGKLNKKKYSKDCNKKNKKKNEN